MTRDTLDRRTVLATLAVGAASATLAGCTSSGGSDDSGGGDGDGSGSGGSGGGGSGSDSVSFDGWFDNTSNFDGVVDETGRSEVTVTVGAKGNNGNYAFAPAAVRVSTGTTVVWEWTGKGAMHNVVANGGEFESEQTREKGFTFSHTFDSTGTYEYYCTPHKAMGMKGAVVVE